MQTKVSVIIPVYNVEPYLPSCLDSVVRQTYEEMEIIVVDDGSTDACGAICDEYAARDTRVTVIHKENGGLVSARKEGLKNATGTYATYVDSDDYIAPGLIASCVTAMERTGADVLAHGYIKDSNTARTVRENPLENGIYADKERETLLNNMLSLQGADYFRFGVEPAVWAKMFRRGLLSRHQETVPAELTIGEDVAVTFPLMADNACAITAVDNTITGYHYRVTPDSMTRDLSPEYFRKISALYRYLKRVFEEKAAMAESLLRQLEDYRLYLIRTKLDELRYKSGMPEAEQIRFLERASENAAILDDLEKPAAGRFTGGDYKRLCHVQNRNWSALYRSYRMEPVKEKIYAALHPAKGG